MLGRALFIWQKGGKGAKAIVACQAIIRQKARKEIKAMSAPITPITSVHFNIGHGVHADYKGLDKWHIPYEGQTTLPTFKICGEPGPENDKNLRELGGKLIWDLRTRE